MKNKLLLTIYLLITNFAFVNSSYGQEPMNDSSNGICDAYRYISVGVGPVIIIPNIGVGYRERYSQLGWDTALSFSTIGYAHQLSAHLVGHYYFDRFRQNSPYIGLGLIGSGVLTNRGKGAGTLSPDFVIGKEFERTGNSRHFIEMHVAAPTLCMGSRKQEAFYLPLMYVKYGFSF